MSTAQHHQPQQQVFTTSQAQIVSSPVPTTTTNAVPALTTTHHLTPQQQQQIQQHHQQQQQQQQQQQHHLVQQSSQNTAHTVVLTNTTASISNQQQQQQPAATVVTVNRNSLDNSKEKCRKFLTNLIELSKREPKPVERNVRTLIQELVDARVEPEEFCERLERLLNASPQPCLIGFLKVRHSDTGKKMWCPNSKVVVKFAIYRKVCRFCDNH
jgi:hypothetical protein